MLVIGLTGGIGAGKTTVTTVFSDNGVPVIDADSIAREVVEPQRETLDDLVTAFGTSILDSEGYLRRDELARLAFADEVATQRLGEIMHPAIEKLTDEKLAALRGSPLVVHDVPLLVENHLTCRYPLVMLVDVPEAVRLHRLVYSRGMSAEDAMARIRAQAQDTERYTDTDIQIDNTGSVEQVREAVTRLLEHRLAIFAERHHTASLDDIWTSADTLHGKQEEPSGKGQQQSEAQARMDASAPARWQSRLERAVEQARLGNARVIAANQTTTEGELHFEICVEELDQATSTLAAPLYRLGIVPVGSSEFISCDPGNKLCVTLNDYE